MKIKFQTAAAFKESYTSIKDISMPFTLSFKLSRINKAIDECIEFYRENYNSLLNNYAEKNEDGTFKMREDGSSILLKKDTIEKARQRFSELDNSEFTIETIKIPFAEFETLVLPPDRLTGLLPFIEIEE